jgi:hypothetical protein
MQVIKLNSKKQSNGYGYGNCNGSCYSYSYSYGSDNKLIKEYEPNQQKIGVRHYDTTSNNKQIDST